MEPSYCQPKGDKIRVRNPVTKKCVNCTGYRYDDKPASHWVKNWAATLGLPLQDNKGKDYTLSTLCSMIYHQRIKPSGRDLDELLADAGYVVDAKPVTRRKKGPEGYMYTVVEDLGSGQPVLVAGDSSGYNDDLNDIALRQNPLWRSYKFATTAEPGQEVLVAHISLDPSPFGDDKSYKALARAAKLVDVDMGFVNEAEAHASLEKAIGRVVKVVRDKYETEDHDPFRFPKGETTSPIPAAGLLKLAESPNQLMRKRWIFFVTDASGEAVALLHFNLFRVRPTPAHFSNPAFRDQLARMDEEYKKSRDELAEAMRTLGI